MSRQFTITEVASHASVKDLYLIIHGKVYDVTKFQKDHPGGGAILFDNGGKDVTELFENAGHTVEARKLRETFLVGTCKREAPVSDNKEPVPVTVPTTAGASFDWTFVVYAVFAFALALIAYSSYFTDKDL